MGVRLERSSEEHAFGGGIEPPLQRGAGGEKNIVRRQSEKEKLSYKKGNE